MSSVIWIDLMLKLRTIDANTIFSSIIANLCPKKYSLVQILIIIATDCC